MNKEDLINEIIMRLNKEVSIQVEKIDENVILPTYSSINDAGMDIRSNEDVIIHPNETVLIKTGLKMSIPSGYEIQVRPRSGLSLNTPLRVSNTPGTIDSGFKDEICIIMSNTSLNGDNKYLINEKGNKQGIYEIKKNDRIAQIVLNKFSAITFNLVDKINDDNNRGGGFGHSGHN